MAQSLDTRVTALEAAAFPPKPRAVLCVFGDNRPLSAEQEATKAEAEAEGREVMVIQFVAIQPARP